MTCKENHRRHLSPDNQLGPSSLLLKVRRGVLSTMACLLSASTSSAGGSIIGNGAGLVENNFAYVYSILPNSIEECFAFKNCDLSTSEQSLLKKIQNVLSLNKSLKTNIEFVSEKQNPGFFTTGDNEDHRIAKTCLDNSCPIYVNLDLLYDKDGKPALEIPTIASVLIHELGHQAGEGSHTTLDILGSKLRKAFLLKISSNKLLTGTSIGFVVSIINQKFPFQYSDLFVGFEDQAPLNITQELMKEVHCSKTEDALAGFELYNGHFLGSLKSADNSPIINYGLWINLSCFNEEREEITSETWEIEFSLPKNLIPEVTKNQKISLE